MRKPSIFAVPVLAVAAALGSAGTALADAYADGSTSNSPGIGSGNLVQAPVHVPVSACGNTVNVVGALNHATDNICTNN
ncbi:small membrane protein [Streptomyces viridiviolaceus]|uniref:Chaplin n=1 Tax=Streptomyces viridiviolaceus TaxID=68282 RepID=A0ABW2EG39_9ACTN|nr:chaplin [Streptomyces viridiviolaceus]GHB76374.1 small membrane protein [Streptomyces viridiviolaceus]